MNFRFNYYNFLIFLVLTKYAQISFEPPEKAPSAKSINVNLRYIDEISKNYPNLLSSKEMRMIKARLMIMQREMSVLMLLGKNRDTNCKSDPTYCIGRTILNATQTDIGYVDAAISNAQSKVLELELERSFQEGNGIMIDSLERLPGSQVMSLFRYLDIDITNRRRGMLLFVVYTGNESHVQQLSRTPDLAENILVNKWSSFIPHDTLTSVISRMCSSIIKVY